MPAAVNRRILRAMGLITVAALALLSASAPPSPDIAAPPPTIPPAVLDDQLEVVGEDIDARQIRTRMFVEVAVDGQGPFRFLVDSGADRSAVGLGLATRLHLPAGPPVKLRGMAGAADVATVLVDRLMIGETEIHDIAAPALPERFIGAQGLLGIDALAEQRLMLDFDAKTITVQDSRRPEPQHGDEIVVTARRRNGQLILTQASVGATHVYAVIDT
ncbi:MAG: retropepsin-like aspartic protease, partial [Janthinobacterium lividum]